MKNWVEVQKVEQLANKWHEIGWCKTLGHVEKGKLKAPIIAFGLGNQDPEAPCLMLTAGVHGLERIGVHILVHYLDTLRRRLKWQTSLQETFKKIRIVAIPSVNPIGLINTTRSNGNGVDLMRNAPTQAESNKYWPLSGHRLSKNLVWYRGDEDQMEVETQLVMDFFREQCSESQFSVSLDVHSGFGLQDRLWHPYGYTKKEFPLIKQTTKWSRIFKQNYPYHFYKVEPQSDGYLISGEIWDHLFDEHFKKHGENKMYMPWTLEIGSWRWVKANPFQLFTKQGMFYPFTKYRYNRTMRAHRPLFDFLIQSVKEWKQWTD